LRWVKKFAAIDISLNRDQQGWLDITYLDDNLRMGEAEGSVYVLTKFNLY